MSSQTTGAAGQPLFDENYPSVLADDLNEISNYAAGADARIAPRAAWLPTIDGIATTSEASGYYMSVGGICIAEAFFRTKDGDYISDGGVNLLNLPIPAIQTAGIPFQIGTVEYTRRSDYRRRIGRVMQSTAAVPDNKALLFIDRADTTDGGRLTSDLATSGSPFTVASTDAVYYRIRLTYRRA